MRKVFLAVTLAFSLAACATISNPVGTTQLAQIESAYGVALSVAVAYRNLPLCRTGTTPSVQNICAKRSVIVRLQAADRNAQGALVAARRFVRNNPTISAASAIGAAQAAVADFQATEAQYGLR